MSATEELIQTVYEFKGLLKYLGERYPKILKEWKLAIMRRSIYYTKRPGVRKKAAMGNSTLPTVLDKLSMVANINTRKLIELKKAEIKIKDAKIQALQEIIDSLEVKINDQARRLDVLYSNKE